MFQLSRFQLGMIFVSLLALRMVVGFHFFKEGTNKLRDGNFTAKPFLAAAKGPLAPYFKSMLDDPDGKVKLCVIRKRNAEGQLEYALDPEFTFLIWDEFMDQATNYYGFGSLDLIQPITTRREKLADQITAARQSDDAKVDTLALERQRAADERSIIALRAQPKRVEEIFTAHKEELADFLDGNQTELVSHFSTSNRLVGSMRDGDNREKVAIYVDSLRGQVDTIRSDRTKQLNDWTSEVNSMWESLEIQINSLAVDAQAERATLPLHRPFDQDTSALNVINKVIPWFDTIVGVLLILGLFSRLASGAAGLFLASVIATQPPLIPGTLPTYFYFIEMAACLVIFATCAGRFGGLDYFFARRHKNPVQQNTEPQGQLS